MGGISFMSANFVARELDYHMTGDWGQGERATNAHFEPLETFKGRFDGLLREIRAMDFEALDLWTAHLNPAWATTDHISIAGELLERHGLKAVSLAGGFGATPGEFEAACRLANTLNIEVLGGTTPLLEENRGFVADALRDHDLKLGIENHPEKNPREMLEKIGDGADGRIGTTIDTGWYATQGYDPVRAIVRLDGNIMHVHLKDVTTPGEHVTTRFGEGCVPMGECVGALLHIGYPGCVSVEHEPGDHDPTEDCKASLSMLQELLRA